MTFLNPDPAAPKRTTPIRSKNFALLGCGGIVVLAVLAVGVIAVNWSRLAGYYRDATSTFSGLITVQAALHKQYGADVRVTVKRMSSVQGSMISVALINAQLMNRVNMDGPEGRQAALDVAAATRDILPPSGRYDNYEIVFQRERKEDDMLGSWQFRFAAADLPPAKAHAGG